MQRLINEAEIIEHCRRVEEVQRQYSIIAPKLSWEMLAGLEPKLANLLHDARNAESYASNCFCRETVWYAELKPMLVEIVGHGRSDYHPILGTCAAYELAYDTILKALPDCRNCSCFVD